MANAINWSSVISSTRYSSNKGDVGQFEPLTHRGRRHAEASSDFLNSDPFIDQGTKRCELIGRMHIGADDIFRQTRFGTCLPLNHPARHAEGSWDGLILSQFCQRGKAPSAGDHLVLIVLR